jgi:hypothetical protein
VEKVLGKISFGGLAIALSEREVSACESVSKLASNSVCSQAPLLDFRLRGNDKLQSVERGFAPLRFSMGPHDRGSKGAEDPDPGDAPGRAGTTWR